MTIDIEKRAQELQEKEQEIRTALVEHNKVGATLTAQYNECIGAMKLISEMVVKKAEDKVITEEVDKK